MLREPGLPVPPLCTLGVEPELVPLSGSDLPWKLGGDPQPDFFCSVFCLLDFLQGLPVPTQLPGVMSAEALGRR